MRTRIAKIPNKGQLGHFQDVEGISRLEQWKTNPESKEALSVLQQAADYLRARDTPVGFPTETVYGLGADATRSGSVKGIFAAKGRPSDNPLIVHVCDLHMLRDLLGNDGGSQIPDIYKPLIDRFWPGPLTILLPNPQPSRLAPEVTAGLPSFGVRMPSSPLALSLIKLTGVPLAAPSANASTKPSPTTAQHVKDDLDGRIELILDGGPCQVGVESTVVDGLCDPPVVLRPGGIGIEELRSCPGWENVTKGYKDQSEMGKSAPRAPGMKYKHYSPKAKVVLYESTYQCGEGILAADVEAARPSADGFQKDNSTAQQSIGVIRTRRWKTAAALHTVDRELVQPRTVDRGPEEDSSYDMFQSKLLDEDGLSMGEVFDIDLGEDLRGIAHGLFSALRELDQRGADIIFIDGIEDETDIAAAVMNRLRKAASEIRA